MEFTREILRLYLITDDKGRTPVELDVLFARRLRAV